MVALHTHTMRIYHTLIQFGDVYILPGQQVLALSLSPSLVYSGETTLSMVLTVNSWYIPNSTNIHTSRVSYTVEPYQYT